MKFVELFHKTRYIHPDERHRQLPSKKHVHSGRNIPITFTTFQTSTYVANEITAWKRVQMQPLHGEPTGGASHPGTSSSNGWLSRDVDLRVLATEMMHPVTGLVFKDRRWHLRLYEKVFIGSECVDWLVRAFADINSREEAEAFGDYLLGNGFFVHGTIIL
jgi:hypothetical protein